MALLDLTTDLKSLRYGRDRIGGGDSREPFITTPINSTPGDTGGTDFLLRANTLQHVADDTSRMVKYLSSPKGLQFAAKQNVLSRSAVRAQAANGPINDGIYLPTSTLAQVATNPFGGHLLKQGINPFADTTTDGSNTGIGILDTILNATLPLSAPFYAKKIERTKGDAKGGKGNRLVDLIGYKLGMSQGTNTESFLDQLINGATGGSGLPVFVPGGFLGNLGSGILNNILGTSPSAGQKYNNISLNQGEILRYDGGPGSALGIGQTSLKRVTDTNNLEDFIYNYSELVTAGDSKLKEAPTTLRDFRSIKNPSSNQSVISTTLDYTQPNERLGGRVNMGDPGRRKKNLSNYNTGTGDGPLDKINAMPLYQGTQMNSKTSLINDLVKFRIGIMDNNKSFLTKDEKGNVTNSTPYKTYIHFRSFIDSFSDNYSAKWNSEQFMGRGEQFYRYGGFSRQIQMSWTVAALSIDELIPMYQKLNFLASSLAPDYSNEGYMQGNIAYLTMGGYCYEQPGIITSLNISPMKESPYEIDIPSTSGGTDGGVKTKELAHYVQVTGFNFIPIHNFVPKLQENTYFGEKVPGGGNYVTDFGQERFIALKNATNNNYDKNNFVRTQPKDKEPEQEIIETEDSIGLNLNNIPLLENLSNGVPV